MEFIKNILKDKNTAFYVALSFAALSLITGIVYIASCLKIDGATALPMVFMLLAGILFAGLSVLGLTKAGSVAMGLMSFAAFGALIVNVAPYVVGAFQNMAMTGFDLSKVEGFPAIVVSAVLMLVCAISGNVFAYIGFEKKVKEVEDNF